MKKTSAGPKTARVGAKAPGSPAPASNSTPAMSVATIGTSVAKGSTTTSAVRSVSPRVLPMSASCRSEASPESRGRMAVVSDTVTMACGTIMMRKLLE